MSSAVVSDEGLDSREIVMGLRLRGSRLQPGSAQACCHLYDAAGELLETVHPGQTRNANGAVVHTGNPLTLSGKWDHERLFVFLDALPGAVARISLVVAPGPGQAVAASCHVSDHQSEHVLLYRELGPVREAEVVATLLRRASGWRFAAREAELDEPSPLADAGMLLRAAAQPGRVAAAG